MAISYVTLSFDDPNPAGANDNDGYKIYRALGEDPYDTTTSTWKGSADLLKSASSSDADWVSGVTTIEYTDNTALLGSGYFYRIEFTRSSDSSSHVGDVYGPVVPSPPYQLGYPNSIPSNNGEVPNFIDEEPLFHFAASHDAAIGNVGTSTATNMAGSYSDYRMGRFASTYDFSIRPWSLDNSVYIYAPIGSHVTSNPFWAARTLVQMPSDPIVNSTYSSNKYVLDEGYTLFIVYPGNFDSQATESGGIWSGGSMEPNVFQLNSCLYSNWHTSNTVLYKFSDKSEWVDPDPPIGRNGDPVYWNEVEGAAFGGRREYSMLYIDRSKTGGAWNHYSGLKWSQMSAGVDTGGMQTNTAKHYSGNGTIDRNNRAIYKNDYGPLPNQDPTALNIVAVTSDGDGVAKGFRNGKLAFHNTSPVYTTDLDQGYVSEAQKANGHDVDSEGNTIPDSRYENQTLLWGRLTGGTAPVNTAASNPNSNPTMEKDPFRAAGLKELTRRLYPVLGDPVMSNSSFCEYLLVPKQLGSRDFLRAVNYLQAKYENKLTNQSDYGGL